MNLAAVQETIRAAVASAAGAADVRWDGEARAARFGKGPQIDLILKQDSSQGVDETRRVYDPTDDKLIETQAGLRQLVVSVRIETDTQKPGENARAYAMRLRARLMRSNIIEQLDAGSVSIVTIQPTGNGDYRGPDGRRVSVAVTDVVFHTVENDRNDAASGDYIARVELHSEYLRDPAGAVSPIQIAYEGP